MFFFFGFFFLLTLYCFWCKFCNFMHGCELLMSLRIMGQKDFDLILTLVLGIFQLKFGILIDGFWHWYGEWFVCSWMEERVGFTIWWICSTLLQVRVNFNPFSLILLWLDSNFSFGDNDFVSCVNWFLLLNLNFFGILII